MQPGLDFVRVASDSLQVANQVPLKGILSPDELLRKKKHTQIKRLKAQQVPNLEGYTVEAFGRRVGGVRA